LTRPCTIAVCYIVDYQCPVGYFCLEGSAQPSPCTPGTFSTSPGQSSCDPCDAGYYCTSGVSANKIICPPYHYCPTGEKHSLIYTLLYPGTQSPSVRLSVWFWFKFRFDDI